MVDTELFGNFLCGGKRMSCDDGSRGERRCSAAGLEEEEGAMSQGMQGEAREARTWILL